MPTSNSQNIAIWPHLAKVITAQWFFWVGQHSVLNVKVVVVTFNQEKAVVWGVGLLHDCEPLCGVWTFLSSSSYTLAA